MKKTLIIFLLFSISQVTFGQDLDEFRELWNSEIIKTGDRAKNEIDSALQDVQPDIKKLLSSHYSNGILKIYRQNKSTRKIVKSYTRNDSTFIERYYFIGKWPVYIEVNHLNQKLPDKFYYDKSNLLLWIDSNENEFTIENEKCKNWWWRLAESMEKLSMILNLEQQQVNEDTIKLSESPLKPEVDSLKVIKLEGN